MPWCAGDRLEGKNDGDARSFACRERLLKRERERKREKASRTCWGGMFCVGTFLPVEVAACSTVAQHLLLCGLELET